MVPTLLAVVEATILSRKLGAASIYSARVGGAVVTAQDPDASLLTPDITLVADEP